MTSKLTDQIDSLVKKNAKVARMAEMGRDAAGKARGIAGEAAGVAREKAEKAAELARAKAGEAAARARELAGEHGRVGAEKISKFTGKVHKESLIHAAESVLDELRNVVMAQTISEIAEVKDQNDELRRKIDDMQRIYDKKISDLQADLTARRAPARTPAKPAAKPAEKPAGK